MKKKLFTLTLCIIMVVAIAVPAFAAEESEQITAVGGIAFPESYISKSNSLRVPLKIKVKGTSEYLNVYTSGSFGDGKSISTWSWTADSTQKFIVYRGSDSITSIRMHDDIMYGLATSSGNCIVRYLPNVGNVNDVTITSIHNQWIGATHGWAFDLQSGGSLTATNTPTQVAGGYKVAWQNYTGSNRQVWNVDPF